MRVRKRVVGVASVMLGLACAAFVPAIAQDNSNNATDQNGTAGSDTSSRDQSSRNDRITGSDENNSSDNSSTNNGAMNPDSGNTGTDNSATDNNGEGSAGSDQANPGNDKDKDYDKSTDNGAGNQSPDMEGNQGEPRLAPPLTRGALMSSLDLIGVGQEMDKLGISASGYVEGGYFYDTTVPGDVTPAKTAPGDFILFSGPYKDAVSLNQVDLTLQRAVDSTKDKWDVGFRVDGIYGRDAFFTHSNGILDQNNKAGGTSGPDNQLDLLQAYVAIAIPFGNGLEIDGGKFVGVLGAEKVDPTQNLFYTHSYQFSYGEPFTQTGVLFKYNLSDVTTTDNSTTVTAGFTRGWNQSTYDNNGELDGVFQIRHQAGPDIFYGGNLIVGPEGNLPYGPSENAHWWVTSDVIGGVKLDENLTISGDFLYSLANSLSQWYGVALYGSYRINPIVALNARGEWYRDGHGITTGLDGSDINYFETTLGLGLTPLPNSDLLQSLTIRPEIRYDWADSAVYDFRKFSQVTAALDVYWKF